MPTVAFVLGAILVVTAELVVAIAHYDGSAVSEKAVRVEDRLDRQLHDWVHRSFALSAPGAGVTTHGDARMTSG